MEAIYRDASKEEVSDALEKSNKAFSIYKNLPLTRRADFLVQIAGELESASEDLVHLAQAETHLEKPRLATELKRTIFQLTSYAEACSEGTWMDIRIDTANKHSEPPRPDLRKMLVPLGPVVVFGASNFPFAYSTAGGDMACALAAGCTVVIKAHPGHAATSEGVAAAVQRAAKTCKISEDVFMHLHGAGFETGKSLVMHPLTAAVGFTGSFEGGKALFDLANNRPVPIPVFAEMGSVNPVFFLPENLRKQPEKLAKLYSSSITQSAGQFCTNPGIMVAIDNEYLEHFCTLLAEEIIQTKPAPMLHSGIAENFLKKRKLALEQKGVQLAGRTRFQERENESIPTLATVSGNLFLQNPLLHKEVFGPFSLMVKCKDFVEMQTIARQMEGQLTATLVATEEELSIQNELVEILKEKCGRFIFNGVPTGVQVSLSMHHGGPFPATTDSRFTAVGADGIKRFSRPLCFQGWPDNLLPEELKNENSLRLWRTVNNELTKQPIVLH